MARKFQIGDTVEVVKDAGKKVGDDLTLDFKIGHRGIVKSYSASDFYPYRVQRKNGVIQDFKPQELKLIRRGTK